MASTYLWGIRQTSNLSLQWAFWAPRSVANGTIKANLRYRQGVSSLTFSPAPALMEEPSGAFSWKMVPHIPVKIFLAGIGPVTGHTRTEAESR